MYEEIIIQKLKSERNKAGYTQEEVAEKTGIPRTMLAKIKTGKQRPDAETIGKLAEFYCVSTDWLFGIGKKREE